MAITSLVYGRIGGEYAASRFPHTKQTVSGRKADQLQGHRSITTLDERQRSLVLSAATRSTTYDPLISMNTSDSYNFRLGFSTVRVPVIAGGQATYIQLPTFALTHPRGSTYQPKAFLSSISYIIQGEGQPSKALTTSPLSWDPAKLMVGALHPSVPYGAIIYTHGYSLSDLPERIRSDFLSIMGDFILSADENTAIYAQTIAIAALPPEQNVSSVIVGIHP